MSDRRRVALADDERAEARQLRRAGASVAALAARFGAYPIAIREALAGLDREQAAARAAARATSRGRARARRRGEQAARARWEPHRPAIVRRRAEARRLWAEGWSLRPIARRLRCAPSTVLRDVAGFERGAATAELAVPPGWHRRAEGPGPPPAIAAASPPEPPPAPAEVAAINLDRALGPWHARGSANGRAVLDEAGVAELKRLHAAGWSQAALARRAGVSRSTVHYALSGATWGHVRPEDGPAPAG